MCMARDCKLAPFPSRCRSTQPMSADPQARREIAAHAAQLVADSAMDYGEAKRRAARDLFGSGVPRSAMPDNDEIDEALREHLELFDAERHPERVAAMREAALDLMERLADFDPYVTGAAWKGIVAEHATLHLQLFSDSGKEVAIHLLNQGIEPEATEAPHFRSPGSTVEALNFEWRGLPVLLSLYDRDELRGALKAARGGEADRGGRSQLQARMQASGQADSQAGTPAGER